MKIIGFLVFKRSDEMIQWAHLLCIHDKVLHSFSEKGWYTRLLFGYFFKQDDDRLCIKCTCSCSEKYTSRSTSMVDLSFSWPILHLIILGFIRHINKFINLCLWLHVIVFNGIEIIKTREGFSKHCRWPTVPLIRPYPPPPPFRKWQPSYI